MVDTLVSAVLELKRMAEVDPTPSVVEALTRAQALLRAELRSRGEVLVGLR